MTNQPPDDMLYEHVNPCANLEFRRDLAHLLNRYGIDNWAETPDIVLADTLAEVVPALRHGRVATARWMGQPLLGEKLAVNLRVPVADVIKSAWPGEDTTPVPGTPYPIGDPRGFREYDPCQSDLCALARNHTARCVAARLDTLARQKREQQ